ncbi:MAG: hypothetical protein H7274_13045 [Rhodoferax sp.]|nr:hypothetical protein [Rhodoferax sp.]
MMDLYRLTTTWIVDYLYDGRPRRWFRAFRPGTDVQSEMKALLDEYYGTRARLVVVRPATPEEEREYLRGEQPKNAYCPIETKR